MKLLSLAKSRKSFRTYDKNGVPAELRQKVEEYAKTIENPFGIPVEFVFLDAEQYGLSSPVLSGEKLYIAGKVEKKPYADVAYGYSFERLVMYAWSLGLGTVWIGGTMKRENFEKAAAVKDGEMMPCISPLGVPAKQYGIKERLMRTGVSADNRFPVEKLFFSEEYGKPVTAEDLQAMGDAAEIVRWAPSAVNKQPWRIVCKDGAWHFYEKKDKGFVSDATGDLQEIDVGIALCHFVMSLEEQGKKPAVAVADPGLTVPEDVCYIATVTC